MFRAAVVVLFLVVLTACGGGEESTGTDTGAPSGTPAPTPVPVPTGTVSYQSGSSTYEVGQYLYVDTTGIDVSAPITASIGGTSVSVFVEGRSLLLAVPRVPSAAQQLRLTTSGGSYTLPMTVQSVSLPAPATYVQDVLADLQTQLQAMPTPANATEAAFLTQLRQQMAVAGAEASGLNAEQMEQLAYFLAGNEIGQAPGPKPAAAGRMFIQAAEDEDACWETAQRYPGGMIKLTKAVAAAAGTITLAAAAPSPATGLIALAAVVNLAINVQRGTNHIDEILAQCLEPFGRLSLAEASSSAAITLFRFNTQEIKAYLLSTEAHVRPAINFDFQPRVRSAGERLQRLYSRLASIMSYLRITATVPDYARRFVEYTGLGKLTGKVSDYAIASISNPNITGSISGSGAQAQVSFQFRTPPSNGTEVSFTFSVSRAGTSESAGTFNGLLKPDTGCPVSLRQQYNTAVLGEWKVDAGDNIRDMSILPNGVATFHVNGQNYGAQWRIVSWDEPVPSYWSTSESPSHPLGVAPGCIMVMSGFFHPAQDGLVRSNLQLPVTGFATYGLGGVFGWPASGNYFGTDLSKVEKGLIYMKQ